jgi:ABC-type branched-subunit amino acid transport system substrate-binding protein
MKRQRKFYYMGLMVALMGLTMISQEVIFTPSLSAAELPPLMIPQILDLTGPYKSESAMWAEISKACTNYINETGGIRGRKVNLEPFDCRYDVGVSTSLMNRFVASDPKPPLISASIGPFLVATKEKLPQAGYRIPCLVPAAYEMFLNPPGWDFCFGLLYTQDFGGFVEWALKNWQEKRPMRVAFFSLNTPGGREPLKMKPWLKAKGVELVAEEYTTPVPVDLTPTILRFKQTEPDFIYGISPVTAFSKLLQEMKKIGIRSKIVLPAFVSFNLMLKYVGKEALEGTYVSSAFNSHVDEKSPGVKAMNEACKKYCPGLCPPDSLYMWPWGHGIIARSILEQTYDKVGSWEKLTGEAVYEFLTTSKAKISTGGITSDLTYNPTRRIGNSALKVIQWKNGVENDVSGWVPIPEAFRTE